MATSYPSNFAICVRAKLEGYITEIPHPVTGRCAGQGQRPRLLLRLLRGRPVPGQRGFRKENRYGRDLPLHPAGSTHAREARTCPPTVTKLCDFHQGNDSSSPVSTGTGKPTTLAAMIDYLNQKPATHNIIQPGRPHRVRAPEQEPARLIQSRAGKHTFPVLRKASALRCAKTLTSSWWVRLRDAENDHQWP